MAFQAIKLVILFSLTLTSASSTSQSAQVTDTTEYEYIVVGSGAGGGPLASRLAMEGHSVLLIEAGDDQSNNPNTTIPIDQGVVTGDPQLRWDIFVNHYQDQDRAKQDPKYVYDTPDGEYVGLTPPPGAIGKGILYPRAATLGGCVTHNALIYINAHDSDWNYIAEITGDSSWSASNMGQYLDKVEEWQPVNKADPNLIVDDSQLLRQLAGGAGVISPSLNLTNPKDGVLAALAGDPNARESGRDSRTGFYPIPLIMQNGTRKSVRERIMDVVNTGYPLTIKPNTFVTKIDFDTTSEVPKATGVQFLEGSHLYRASPLSGGNGTSGSVTATKEVILAGGTYNTVQMLKLSGIGPKSELASFGISSLVDLPGVGTNMQDRYEIGLNVQHEANFTIFSNPPSWNALAGTMIAHSDYADDSDVDMFIFGAPVNFTGYFPEWYEHTINELNFYSWYTLKAHTRNRAGTVQLKSADPLDTPIVNFNYFDTGTTADGADAKDLASMVQALKLSREALQRYTNNATLQQIPGSPFHEFFPGPEVQTDEELGTYIKKRAWGHHASCSNPIGADDDPMAVLDSKFRVRGTEGLRVVDASAFPRIPGVFITAPILVLSEKAADVIMNDS